MQKIKKKLNKVLTSDDLQAIGDVVYNIVDKQVATLATKKDLQDLESRMATKDDLGDLESRLNTRMDEGFESVMDGIDSVADTLAEKERVENLEKWVYSAGKNGIKPKAL